jgi:hypothetical protein
MASALRECAESQVGEMHLENDRSLSKRLIKDERYISGFQTSAPGVAAESWVVEEAILNQAHPLNKRGRLQMIMKSIRSHTTVSTSMGRV